MNLHDGELDTKTISVVAYDMTLRMRDVWANPTYNDRYHTILEVRKLTTWSIEKVDVLVL